MISKAFRRGTIVASNIITTTAERQLFYALSQKPHFYFSNQPQQQSNDQKEGTSKQQRKRLSGKSALEHPLATQAYLRRIGLHHHKMNGPLLKKLDSLNKILISLKSFESQNKQHSFYGYKTEGKFLMFFWPFVLMFVAYALFKKKQLKNENLGDILLNRQKKVGQQNSTSPHLEEIVNQISEIHVLPLSRQSSVSSTDEENSDEYEAEKKKTKKRINYEIAYKITLKDSNGNEYIAMPYQGDPNILINYIDSTQKRNHKSDKLQVFFQSSNAKTYKLSEAFSQSFGFFAIFIPVAISLFIFRATDPTAILRNFGQGAKQFKIQAMKDIKTRFKDVAGMEQAKKQITQFVDFLKYNEKYREIGAKIPKGALLTGPPGTGKTMLAKACAGEANVAFFYISGSQFVQVFVGLGASKVRDLFAKARQNAPSIIFIDEIDAIGKKRQTSRNQEKDTTLNQLLVQMDGFSSNETIVVLAATNRKEILDNALTRPGRFDRMVQITLPDVKARQQIFMVHLAPLKIDPNVELRAVAKRLSELSPGFSGADIANLCNEAAIIATRKDRTFIIDKDFEEATQRITAGYIKKNLMKQKTKKRVAYHEAGHAVSSWFLKGGDPLVKLTIIPRSKGSLGYAQYMPKSTYIMAKNELIDKVAIMLGGITAEEVFFGDITSGGSDDLQKVYSLTRRMVTQFGMGKQTYNMTIDQQSYIQKQSTYLSDKMEQEVASILQQAKKRSRQTIQSKRQVIEALAKTLIQRQTLNSDQILKIMGERPNFDEPKKSEMLV